MQTLPQTSEVEGAPTRGWAAGHSQRAHLASRAPIAKDCADGGLADCGLERATFRFRDLGPPRSPT
eukprot:3657893-Alexandrium_andersonii.AAC.1